MRSYRLVTSLHPLSKPHFHYHPSPVHWSPSDELAADCTLASQWQAFETHPPNVPLTTRTLQQYLEAYLSFRLALVMHYKIQCPNLRSSWARRELTVKPLRECERKMQ